MDFDDIHIDSLKKPVDTDLAQRAKAVHYTNKMPTMPVKDAGKIQHTDSHFKARYVGYYKRLMNWLRGLKQLEEDTKNKDVIKISELISRFN